MEDWKRLTVDETVYETRLSRKYERRRPWAAANPKLINAQIPGVILSVQTRPGQKVQRGDPLLVLEAMKMKNAVQAPYDGTVRAVAVNAGQMVMKGQLLVEFE